MNARPLERRRALVTGASGGIGGAVAWALAGAGAGLVLTYSSHRRDAETAARSVRETGSAEPHVIQADLSAPDAGRRLARQVADDIGNIDVLVTIPGVGRQLRWDEVDDNLEQHLRRQRHLGMAAHAGPAAGNDRAVVRTRAVRLLDRGAHRRADRAALRRQQSGAPRARAPPGGAAGDGITVNALAPALHRGHPDHARDTARRCVLKGSTQRSGTGPSKVWERSSFSGLCADGTDAE